MHPRQVLKEIVYLVFPSEGEARARSVDALRALQSQRTINDPKTVTKELWGVEPNASTGRASIAIPFDDPVELARLTEEERTRLKTREAADADGDRTERPPLLPSGGGGRGSILDNRDR